MPHLNAWQWALLIGAWLLANVVSRWLSDLILGVIRAGVRRIYDAVCRRIEQRQTEMALRDWMRTMEKQ